MRTLLALSIISFAVAPATVAGQVYFADAKLQAAVKDALGITMDPTEEDMQRLDKLDVGNRGITDLTGIEYATNATYLDLGRNDEIRDLSPLSGLESLAYLDVDYCQIRDLDPLRGLVNLMELHLEYNLGLSNLDPLEGLVNLEVLHLQYCLEISDLQPLSGLTRLRTLSLTMNRISDLQPLSGLTSLEGLYLQKNGVTGCSALSGLPLLETLALSYNQISDISPLCDLTSLTSLDLEGNPLDASACAHISLMLSHNPLLRLSYNPCLVQRYALEISATPGGRVIDPGEGTFFYEHGTPVHLQAEARPSFVFVGWSGAISDARNPVTVTMDGPHTIQANFRSELAVLYVDDDAPGDPLPGDSAGGDPEESGSLEHPFDRIQEAIEVALEGSEIRVLSGTYRERIDLLGKALRLTGMDPNGRGSYPVIAGHGTGPVFRFERGEDPNCTVTGFVITQGQAEQGSGLYCLNGSPRIRHCLIVGNRSTHPDGAAVYCKDSHAIFEHCTIAENVGGGMVLEDSPIELKNSIVWANGPRSIVAVGFPTPTIRFSNVQGGWSGTGNMDLDPLFAQGPDADDPNWAQEAEWRTGDYHLQSQAGRWHPRLPAWVQDEQTSPCIDAGDPNSPFDSEPNPNGSRANLGAYGATAQASLSY